MSDPAARRTRVCCGGYHAPAVAQSAGVKFAQAGVTGVEYASATQAGQGLAGLALFPDHYLGPFAPVVPTPTEAPVLPQQRPGLPRSLYPVIAERARYESLRELAAAYGVSRRLSARSCDVETLRPHHRPPPSEAPHLTGPGPVLRPGRFSPPGGTGGGGASRGWRQRRGPPVLPPPSASELAAQRWATVHDAV